jgi:16S rRNA (cytosine967-C5)-methyltransferase
LFGDLNNAHVVDFCAAPGGKTMQMAAMGAQVTAIDRSAQRLKRLQDNLQRLRLEKHVEVVASDAAAWKPKTPPTHILLDAPCSATGTIRRHPDVPHLKTQNDIDRLCDTQARLLNHAADILAVGGTLIYCTCSLQKSEGEDQIAAFLKARSDLQRDPIRPEEIGMQQELSNEHGDLRILPFHLAAIGGMDGFFVARLRKKD